MYASVGAVDDIDITAIIRRKVVRLDGDFAGGRVVVIGAPIISSFVGRGDIEGHLLRVKRISDIDSPHARVEVGDEHDLLVEGRTEFLLGGMGTEPPATVAELSV